MPTISIDRGLTYFYTDTRPLPIPDCKTLILVHGYTFHAGTFKLFSQAALDSQRMRVICINRRHNPGTAPFSKRELDIIASGTDDDRLQLLTQQGVDIAVLIDALITQCADPLRGGVTLAGWSLGATFVLAMLAAYDAFPKSVLSSLSRYLTAVVLWVYRIQYYPNRIWNPLFVYILPGGITYCYTDTGPAPTPDYKTLVLVHGHTFHAGTFKRFSQLAIDSQRMRVICINRRHYPGTTPFSQHELDIIASGSNDDRARLLVQQGIDMALLIDALIAQCRIPLTASVTLAGWSLGATFVLAMLAACDELQADVRASLKKYLTGVVMWDMPSAALGLPDIPDAYSPLGDPSVPPEALPVAFGTWVSSFYTHGDFMAHGISQINTAKPTQCTDPTTPERLPTIQKLTPEDISAYIDFSLSTEHDTAILIAEEGRYRQVIYDITQKALFDPQVRKMWKGTRYYYLHSDCSPWAFVYSACALKEMCDLRKEEGKKCEVTFKCFKNANHFPMLEEPEVALHGLYDLLTGGSEHSGEEKSAVAESATVDSDDMTSSRPSQPWLAGAVNA